MKKVSDIMTTEVVTIRNSATVTEAAKVMKEKGVHALIVEQSHELDAYGIISVKDVVSKVIALGRDPEEMRVYEIMTKPCTVLNPDLGVEYAAQLLSQANLNSAPVIQGKLLGIVSMTDILERSGALEQPQNIAMLRKVRQLSDTARRICQESGLDSSACTEAWAAADDLRVELARQRSEIITKTPFERFQEDHPELFLNKPADAKKLELLGA